MNKYSAISIGMSLLMVGGMVWLLTAGSPTDGTGQGAAYSGTNGTQVIDVAARGGYSPRVITAKAGVPTTLRINTNGTFDCSASVVIPKLGYQKFLQPTGTAEVAISAEQAQGTVQGLCAMGMYNFQIRFQ